MNKFNMAYLASPYSLFPAGIQAAFEQVCQEAGRLIRHGVPVFSPIALSHPLAVWGDLDPKDHSLWLPFDEPFMRWCDLLIVLEMEGWKESFGMAHEIEHFARAGKPIVHMKPGQVPAEFLPGGRFAPGA